MRLGLVIEGALPRRALSESVVFGPAFSPKAKAKVAVGGPLRTLQLREKRAAAAARADLPDSRSFA